MGENKEKNDSSLYNNSKKVKYQVVLEELEKEKKKEEEEEEKLKTTRSNLNIPPTTTHLFKTPLTEFDPSYYEAIKKSISNITSLTEKMRKQVMENLNFYIERDPDKDNIIVSEEVDNLVYSITGTIKQRHTFSTNLKKIMQHKDLNVSDLSNLVKVPYSTANDWVNGVSLPRYNRLTLLAEKLGVSKEYLLETHVNSKMVSRSTRAGRVPVLGRIPAGIPIEAIEDIIDFEEIPYKWFAGQKEFFALQIKGDSMYPTYTDGDRVIFQQADDCESGQHCAVMVNGNDATFKKVLKSEVGITLVPLNEEYEPTFYSNKQIRELPVRIIGIAKEIRRKLF